MSKKFTFYALTPVFHFAFYVAISVAILSCSTKKDPNQDGSTINLTFDEAQTGPSYLSMVDSFSFIKLDHLGKGFVSDINQLVVHKDFFYIFDRSHHKILQFTLNGEFRQQLHHVGAGPEEYQSINSFQIDPSKDHLIVHDSRGKKLIWFDLDFNFIKSKSIPYYFNSFHVLSETNTALMYFGNNPQYLENSAVSFYSIGHFNLENAEPVGWHLPFEKEMAGKTFGGSANILGDPKTPKIVRDFDPTIYQWKNDTIKPLFKLHFSRGFISKEDLYKEADFINFIQDARKNIREISGIQQHFETDRYLHLKYTSFHPEAFLFQSAFIDLDSHEIIHPRYEDAVFQRLTQNGNTVVHNNFLIKTVTLDLLNYMRENMAEDIAKSKVTLPDFDLENDNPYLFIYRLK